MSLLNNPLINIIASLLKRRTFSLTLIGLIIFLRSLEAYYLSPNLMQEIDKQSAFTSRSIQEKAVFSPDQIINILFNFTSVNSDNLWIETIKVSDDAVDLVIRSIDTHSIEYYIYEVSEMSDLIIESTVIKNTANKDAGGEEEEEKDPVPFAVQLYLDSLEGQKQDGDSDEDDSKNNKSSEKHIFSYEAKVKLRKQAF